jgi:hypothetical protein
LPRHLVALAGLAAAVWLATVAMVLTADWFLTCTVDGQQLGGIDCFQTYVLPQTESEPAAWFGFLPLAIAWLLATGTLATCFALTVRAHTRP